VAYSQLVVGSTVPVSSVNIDSQAAMQKSKIVRRHYETGEPTSLGKVKEKNVASAAALEETKVGQPDLYTLIGSNRCNGGGYWKRYKMLGITPAIYKYCAASCDSKGECVGFDIGNDGCNMYTQKAVPVGTWPSVRFLNAGPFDGEGNHDAFAKTPFDLTVGTGALQDGELFQCYRKTYYKPVESYYWLIGTGTCSGGGMWKRYKVTPANYSSCEDACNIRDECVGFDIGSWIVSEDTEQIFQAEFNTSAVTTTGCFMYTQKPVFGTWPGVMDVFPEDGEGAHDAYPPTPNDLTIGHVARYEAGNLTKCYGKTHSVTLAQYYQPIGATLCSGGGSWKHYKLMNATVEECKLKCDEKDSCLGLDWKENVGCRLYSRIAIPPGTWSGVMFDAGIPFPGEKDHDAFPETPWVLKPTNATPSRSMACLAKTHYESPGQFLGDGDAR